MAWAKQVKTLTIGAILWFMACMAFADVVVVVSRDSHVNKLSRSQVVDIFLGRMVQLPNGMKVAPVDLPEDSNARKEFYEKLLGKSPAQMKAYWSKIIFTGRGVPPREEPTLKRVKHVVSGNVGLVGYLAKEVKDSSVKTVLLVD